MREKPDKEIFESEKGNLSRRNNFSTFEVRRQGSFWRIRGGGGLWLVQWWKLKFTMIGWDTKLESCWSISDKLEAWGVEVSQRSQFSPSSPYIWSKNSKKKKKVALKLSLKYIMQCQCAIPAFVKIWYSNLTQKQACCQHLGPSKVWNRHDCQMRCHAATQRRMTYPDEI